MPADGTTPGPAAELLADVLSLLTGDSRGAWLAMLRSYGGGLPRDVRFNRDAIRWGRATQAPGQVERDPRVFTRPWLTIPDARHPDGTVTPAHLVTVAEALEMLATRGVWPWEVGADDAPRWWCERCDAIARRRAGEDVPYPADKQPSWQRCDGDGAHAPPSLPALVAAASNPRLREAVTLARELAGDAEATVVLRVMGAGELRGIAKGVLDAWDRKLPDDITDDADAPGLAADLWETRISPTSPASQWSGGGAGVLRASTVARLPALGALLDTGVLLLDLAPGRVTLGVEAVGSDR